MQTFKKLFLVATLALALTACGGGEEGNGSGDSGTNSGSTEGLNQTQVESAVLLDVDGYTRSYELTSALPTSATAAYESDDDGTVVNVDAVQGLAGMVEDSEATARLQFLDQGAEINTDTVSGVNVYSGMDENSYKALMVAGDYQFMVKADVEGDDTATAMKHVEAVVEAMAAQLSSL